MNELLKQFKRKVTLFLVEDLKIDPNTAEQIDVLIDDLQYEIIKRVLKEFDGDKTVICKLLDVDRKFMDAIIKTKEI